MPAEDVFLSCSHRVRTLSGAWSNRSRGADPRSFVMSSCGPPRNGVIDLRKHSPGPSASWSFGGRSLRAAIPSKAGVGSRARRIR